MSSKTKVHIILAFLLSWSGLASGQNGIDTLVIDSIETVENILPSVADTLPVVPDSAMVSAEPKFKGIQPINWEEVVLAEDSADEQISYSSRDSMFFDLQNKQIHLYGNAKVDYQSVNMTANYILIDWEENIMEAEGKRVPNAGWIGKPKFIQGGQDVSASKIRYNFKTSKGIIYDVQTMQQGMNVVGTKGKFIGAGQDSTKSNTIYNRDAIFSSCDLEHPHFGIRSNKQKIVQDKVAIVGPSNVEIGGIPTPLWLPFGFFPIKPNKSTGLIFPQGYEYSENWGFGLEGVGWYFPISDKLDLKLTSDIYLKGTFRIHGNSNYFKRYKYRGSAYANFAYLRSEDNEAQPVFTPSMGLRWSHTQDPKAHPYRTFGGNINIQTSNYQQTNLTTANSQFQTTLSSNMSYRQKFDKPFDLSVAFSHSQNTKNGDVIINFPTVSFQTETLKPFKRKVATGGERWYERIQMRYTSEAKNQFNAKDTTLFTQKTLDDAQYGVRHNLTASTSFNLLKYFNFTPNATYKEVWYFRTVDKTFDPTPTFTIDTLYNADSTEFQEIYDTTEYGQTIDMNNFGFKPFRQYNVGISMNTKIFGTFLFKGKKLKGLRHVISPTVSLNFTPDYTNPDWGYFKSVQTDLRDDELELYSVFENNRISGFEQPSASGKQMSLNYSFNNQLEAKVFSKKTEKDKIIKLFRSLTVGGSYNFAADSLQWSDLRISGNQSFFNNITTFRFGINYSPYTRNETTGRKINQFYYDTNGKVLRLVNWNSTITTNLTVGKLRDLIKGVDTNVRVANETDEEKKEEDLLSLFEKFSINHSFTVKREFNSSIGKDTTVIAANTISTRGNFQLTPNWRVSVGNIGYDFQSKRITYPDFSFFRDLHCWEMGISWQPFYETYSFFIRVKPGHLDFINVPYGKGRQDGFRGF